MGTKILIVLTIIATCCIFPAYQTFAQQADYENGLSNQGGGFRDPCRFRPDLEPCKGHSTNEPKQGIPEKPYKPDTFPVVPRANEQEFNPVPEREHR